MYPVLTPKEMSDAEHKAYEEGFYEEAFMEEAGSKIAEIVHVYMRSSSIGSRILLLCGKGNNGGDAYVAGRALLLKGYDVSAYQTPPKEGRSSLSLKKGDEFIQSMGKVLEELPENISQQFDLIIDGLFGTGFHGALSTPYDAIVERANDSKLPIVAVDIPSGLNGETGEVENSAIRATLTIFLGACKTGFFLKKGWNLVGELVLADFHLPAHTIKTSTYLIKKEDVQKLLPPVVRNRHKYERGYVVAVAGSPSMPGAALLSTLSALRAGSGIVRLMHPEGMEQLLVSSPYELIKTAYKYNDMDFLITHLNRAKAIFMGPGLGVTDETKKLMLEVLPNIKVPCVLDADALNIQAIEKMPYPENTVITPHLGEMSRLLGFSHTQELNRGFLKSVLEYAMQNKIVIVLKGAPTFLIHPEGKIWISPYGNPGMATAGSGDVLTGIVASFLSQKLSPWDAAALSVVMHGLAGDHAIKDKTVYSLIASDIIHALPVIFDQFASE